MTQLNYFSLNWEAEWYTSVNNAPNEYANVAGNSSAASQHTVHVPTTTPLINTSLNWEPERDLIDIDSFIPNENTNLAENSSAIPSPYNLPLPLPFSNANANPNDYPVGQNRSPFLIDYDFANAAGYSSAAGSSFDLEWKNAARDANEGMTTDWTTNDSAPPNLAIPHNTYQSSNSNNPPF